MCYNEDVNNYANNENIEKKRIENLKGYQTDFILKQLKDPDNYSRDENGNRVYGNEIKQISKNLQELPEYQNIEGENYLSYYKRMNSIEDKEFILLNDMEETDTQYVSNVLNYSTDLQNEYGDLGKNVFIAAGTGRGKNTFIKEQILSNACNVWGTIVMFYNRESLLSQQIIDMLKELHCYNANVIEAASERNMVCFGPFDKIMMISYQEAAEKILKKDWTFCNYINRASIMVFDEIHYIFDDSMFSKQVNFIANLIKGHIIYNQAVRIFMSATMEETFLYFQKIGYIFTKTDINSSVHFIDKHSHGYYYKRLKHVKKINRVLYIPNNYDYINPVPYTSYDSIIRNIGKSDDKWLIFVNSIRDGNDLMRMIDSEYGEGTAVFINSDNKTQNSSSGREYSNILKNEKFDSKVLIATTVIYNGVNIKDKCLKNLVLPVTTIPVIKQLVGRKRINMLEDEKLNVYFNKSDISHFAKRFDNNINEYRLINRQINVLEKMNDMNMLSDKYCYYASNENNQIVQYPSDLSRMKLFIDTAFYLYVIRRFKEDSENAFLKIQLESFGIEDKFEEAEEIYARSQQDNKDRLSKEMTAFLNAYIGNRIVDKCVDGNYSLIPEFTKKFDNIYYKYNGRHFNSQWKNHNRVVAECQFNDVLKKYDISYIITISAKDKKTDTKILSVEKT